MEKTMQMLLLVVGAGFSAAGAEPCDGDRGVGVQVWVMPETDAGLWQRIGEKLQGKRSVPPYKEYAQRDGRHYLCCYVETAQGQPAVQWVDITAYCMQHLPALYEYVDAIKRAEVLIASIHSAETGDAVADELAACLEQVMEVRAHKLFPACIYEQVLQERGVNPDRMLEALYRLVQKNYYGSQKLRANF